ncbi:hypothetical protein LshimejAT787_0503820 [Lyophyllum shimeji]|uniref:Uncharacterized protein n=1 Tax=Lyophyllum shimeji TaxID=47721 RepID=A0A9P3UMN4_LYOSH|nr:hypothetical protein LshimejAT787_0503820 [Lyophyllum shimeji]
MNDFYRHILDPSALSTSLTTAITCESPHQALQNAFISEHDSAPNTLEPDSIPLLGEKNDAPKTRRPHHCHLHLRQPSFQSPSPTAHTMTELDFSHAAGMLDLLHPFDGAGFYEQRSKRGGWDEQREHTLQQSVVSARAQRKLKERSRGQEPGRSSWDAGSARVRIV